MHEIARAYAAIPEDHLGITIGLVAVLGGILLGGIAIWRGISMHGRVMELRSRFIIELVNAGLPSKEILAILDHPFMTTMSGSQMKHSKAVLAMLEGQEHGLTKNAPRKVSTQKMSQAMG